MPASPLLFHPVPTRPALLRLFSSHSFDSDNAESTVAQVGVQCPLIASDQIEENQAWRCFVASSDDIQISIGSPTLSIEKSALERLISPGVSCMGQTELPHDNPEERPRHALIWENTGINGDMEETSPIHAFGGMQSYQSGIIGSANQPNDDQADSAPEDLSPEVIYKTLMHSIEESQVGGGEIQRGHMMSVISDEVSLLVVPSTLSTSSIASALSCNDTILQAPRPKELSPLLTTHTTQPMGCQEPDGPSSSESIPHTIKAPRKDTPEDEHDMWKKFVFGGSDESPAEALADARKETARNLLPSITSSSTYDEVSKPDTHSYEDFHELATSSLLGPVLGVDRLDCAHNPEYLAIDSLTTASASNVATAVVSSPALISELRYPETTTRTDEATAGSSNSSIVAQRDAIDGLIDPMATEITMAKSDKESRMVQSQQLEKLKGTDENFKFVRPKLFMGKKLGPVDEQRQVTLSTAQIRGRNQTRRRSTRTRDGRANIRKLPNYGNDPIEEFEEDAQSNQAQQGSFFGSLETEESF